MYRKPVIKNVLGGFMLMLFAFSITPKKVFHDLLAHHKDRAFLINDSNAQQLNWGGFHCHCDNLVVESPFINSYTPPEPAVRAFHAFRYASPVVVAAATQRFYFALRGPPQFAA